MKLLKKYRKNPHLIFTVILCLIMSLVVAWKTCDFMNTLERNGNWGSEKSRLPNAPFGGPQFVRNRNSLAHNQVDLGKWHGNKSIHYIKPFNFGRAKLKVKLTPGSYLVLTFQGKDGEATGIRISRNDLFPSAVLTFDSKGGFIRKQSLSLPTITGDWQDLQITGKGPNFVVTFNSHHEGVSFQTHLPSPAEFGIKGGTSSVLIESVVLTDSDGREIIDEDFANRRGIVFYFFLAAFLFFLINRTIFRREFKRDAILFNTSLLISLSIICILDHYYFAERYYEGVGNPQSHYDELFQKWNNDINRSIDQAMDIKAEVRIMLIGSSQTWGEGASSESRKWSKILQKKINDARKDDLVYVFNAGIRDLTVKKAFQEFSTSWSRWKPNVVIIDFGNNDKRIKPFTEFGKSLDEFAKFNQSIGVQTLLILEPNNPETHDMISNQKDFRPAMEEVAKKYKTAFLNADLHFKLHDVRDSGQVWVDHVHFADHGHELFAELIFQTLKKNKLLGMKHL